MKTTRTLLLLLLAAGSIRAAEPAQDFVPLNSLHGTMITMISETEGIPAEIWAKGDRVRAETSFGEGKKIVTIQRGDTMYMFAPGAATGHRTKFASGLATRGLVEQIAVVRANGKIEGTETVDGVVYEEFNYDANAPLEWTVAVLARKTGLPRYWISAVRTEKDKAEAIQLHYRNMQANVDVADELFEVPKGIKFEEVPAAAPFTPAKPAAK